MNKVSTFWSFTNTIKSIYDSVPKEHNLVAELEAEIRFFTLKKELAIELIQSIEECYQKDLEQSEFESIEYTEEFDYLTDSNSLLIEVTDEQIEHFQKRISEEIYYYLDFLSRELTTSEDCVESFNDVLSYEMSRTLGLPSNHKSILKLTGAFVEWIKNEKKFVAAWGTISWYFGDCIELLSYSKKTEVKLKIINSDLKAVSDTTKAKVAAR